MNFKIPEKTSRCALSPIRAVIARGSKIDDFISLALGNPAVEAIPAAVIQKAAHDVMTNQTMEVLQYGPALGDEELMACIKHRLVYVKKMPADNHTLIITSGASQALGLIPRAFTEPGDEVYAEQFSYPSALNAIRCSGATLVGIDTDDKGMNPELLEQAAKSGKGKYIYLNPTFQNPTGFTMPLERRKEIYAIAKKYNLLILEDDPYGEIRFKGEDVPTFKSIDDAGIVIYVGSYSKTLSAGLRIGFIYAENTFGIPLANVKNNMDGETPLFNQRIVYNALTQMNYEEHLKKIQGIYRDKCVALRDTLVEQCSPKIRISDPEGGMFLWVTLPDYVDPDAFSEQLFIHKVGAVKSSAFAANSAKPGTSFRLNYTSLPLQRLAVGAERFAEVTRFMCSK